jgi:hypothetical protein
MRPVYGTVREDLLEALARFSSSRGGVIIVAVMSRKVAVQKSQRLLLRGDRGRTSTLQVVSQDFSREQKGARLLATISSSQTPI